LKLADRWRVRAFALACVALLGCDDRTTRDPTVVQEKVIDKIVPDPTVTRIDILYVLDRSPALSPYRDSLARQFSLAGASFASLPGYVDLHVGVVSADLGGNTEPPAVPVPGQCAGWGDGGALLRSSLVDDAFIALRQTPVAQHTNVHGTLAAALPSLADVGTVGCERAQPLEAMRIALDANPHNAGFSQPDAYLFVIFVAATTDTSPRSLAEYAAFLHSVKADPNHVFVFVVGADPRMHGFAALFPNREEVLSLEAPEVVYLAEQTYDYLHPFGPIIASPCFDTELLDVDPDRDGVQPDCVVTERVGGVGTLMQACDDGPGLPCWHVIADPQNCGAQLALSIERGDLEPPDGGIVEAQCVAP